MNCHWPSGPQVADLLGSDPPGWGRLKQWIPMTDPNGAAICIGCAMDPINKYTPVMLALIYQHHGSVTGLGTLKPETPEMFHSWFFP